MKFRKKPVLIEAVQWTGQNADEVLAMATTVGVRIRKGQILLIDTLEVTMLANHGDWVIKNSKGEVFTCKPDAFDAAYEPAEETAHA